MVTKITAQNKKTPYSGRLPTPYGKTHGTTQASSPQKTQEGLSEEHSPAVNMPRKGKSPST